MDFVHDQLATGTKLRALTIVDTFSRFSPAIEPRFNFRGADVVGVLERVGRVTGFRRPSGSTRALSLCHAIWIYGRTSAASHSTSHDRANRPTTLTRRASTLRFDSNAWVDVGSLI